ncbi:MAG: FIVAR domain-containing protein [Treponema sp.]|jgi:hypothetical protein|nr:FIVAR domain-containing protein [Treponema sp.]
MKNKEQTMKRTRLTLMCGFAAVLAFYSGCSNFFQREAAQNVKEPENRTYGQGNVEINFSKPDFRTLLPTLEGGSFHSLKIAIEWKDMNITNPSRTVLETALLAAYRARSAVKVDSAAVNVPLGSKWVTQTDMNTFNSVINAAQTVYADIRATQEEVNAAAAALTTAATGATAVFNGKRQDGSKNIRQALIDKLGEAYTKRANVAGSSSAANVYSQAKYVSTANMTTFNNAIKAAEDVLGSTSQTQAQINAAVTTLNTAINSFNPGSGTRTTFYQSVTSQNNTINSTGTTGLNNLRTNVLTAWEAKKGVVPASSAANVPQGVMYVTTARWNSVYQWSGSASSGAIETAEYHFLNSSSINTGNNNNPNTYAATWATTMSSALTNTNGFGAFNGGTGRYANFGDGTFLPILTTLTDAIGTAYQAKLGVAIGTSAGQVSQGVKFVEQNVMDALNTAISTAENAVFTIAAQTEVTSALNALNGAIGTFNGVKNSAGHTGTYVYIPATIEPVYIPGDAARYIADIPAPGNWTITVTALKSQNPDVAIVSGSGVYTIDSGYNPPISISLKTLAGGNGTLRYRCTGIDALPAGSLLMLGYGQVDPQTGLPPMTAPVPGNELLWAYFTVGNSDPVDKPHQAGFYGLRLLLYKDGDTNKTPVILADEIFHIYANMITDADFNVQKLVEGPRDSGYSFKNLNDETITWTATMWGGSANDTISITVPSEGVWYWYVNDVDASVYFDAGSHTFTITKDQLRNGAARPGPNHITAIVQNGAVWNSKRVYFLLDN